MQPAEGGLTEIADVDGKAFSVSQEDYRHGDGG